MKSKTRFPLLKWQCGTARICKTQTFAQRVYLHNSKGRIPHRKSQRMLEINSFLLGVKKETREVTA
jgi:hypothetical protein